MKLFGGWASRLGFSEEGLAFLRENYDIEGALRDSESGENATETESRDPETSSA